MPKKSLGQNFLKNQDILSHIVKCGNISKKDIIIEIGPGTGNLTEKILEKEPEKFIVIEKDKKLSELLHKKFRGKIEIINEDILNCFNNFVFKKKVKVFGNLPYNISTKILSTWCLNNNLSVSKMILMFQKEVAERIVAKVNTKNYSRITVLSNWKFNIRKIIDVKPNSFFPKPKVHSTVLEFTPKKKIHKIEDPKNLEKITRVFFNQRRKMIKKPINLLFKDFQFDYKKLDIKPSDRPQNLNLEKYLGIVNEYETLRS